MAKFLPGFVYRYLERIIQQDFINGFLSRHGHKDGMGFINGAIDEFNVNIITRGEKNIPGNGRFIIVSNHPLGGFDGLMLIYCLRKHFNSVKFLVNDILMNIKMMDEFFVPINKHGSQSRLSVKLIDEVYDSDSQIITFPAGYVSRKIKGVIQDLEWQKSFIAKSIQYKRDVIPVHISGENTKFFYRLANFRKFFGIKWNLEMFYLPDETIKHRNKTLTMTFGQVIPHTTFDTSLTHIQWAAKVREIVYSLPDASYVPLNSKK